MSDWLNNPTESDWARFGKKIYDLSMNQFYDKKGIRKVVCPFKTDDGFTAVATINECRHLVEVERRIEDGEPVTYFRTVYPKSDGSFYYTEWTR